MSLPPMVPVQALRRMGSLVGPLQISQLAAVTLIELVLPALVETSLVNWREETGERVVEEGPVGPVLIGQDEFHVVRRPGTPWG